MFMEKKMPSIKELFVESWEAFKGSFGNVFILSLIGSVFGFLVIGVVFLSVAGMGFLTAFGETMSSEVEMAQKLQTFFTLERMTITGILIGLLFLVATIWGSIVRIAIIAAVGGYKEKITLGGAIKVGFTTFVPVFIMSFVASIIVMGSWFALIIPGILVGLYLQYVTYEIVIGQKKWWSALKGSVQIMSQNLGEVLLRMIIFYLGAAILFYLPMYLIGMLAGNSMESATAEAVSVAMIMSPIRFILSMLIGFFSAVYSIVTYKQAKEVTRKEVSPGIAWILIVSIVGWVIGLLLINAGYRLYMNPFVKEQMAVVEQEIKKEVTEPTEPQRIAKWKEVMSPEVKALIMQSEEKFSQMRVKAQESKPNEVKRINDENILIIKKALAIQSDNPEIWDALASAYTWISSNGSLEDSLEAARKAEELDPKSWKYVNNTANILQMMGKHDEAIIKYQQVIRMEDNYGRAHISLGISYKAVGVKDLAKQELQKGIDILSKYNEDGKYDLEILNARKEMGEL